jgi:hypothetical protein
MEEVAPPAAAPASGGSDASSAAPWFTVVHGAGATQGPRLGRATVRPGRGEVSTPGWLPATRKGCVPHLTPDLLARIPHLDALQLPLQDLYAVFVSRCHWT